MKATRKLIPAIAMLLISAVMMSTATFAWFSTNSQVSANSLIVSAKADTTFLVIGNTEDEVKVANYQVIDIKAPAASGTEGVLIPIAFDETTIGIDDAALNGKFRWYTATAAERDDEVMDADTKKTASPADGYVLKRTFYFTIADGFVPATGLKLASVDVNAESASKEYANCISVVAVPKDSTDWKNANAYDASTGKVTANTALHANLDSDTVVAVDVYVFIDGDHANVYTDNIKNLVGLDVSVSFKVG